MRGAAVACATASLVSAFVASCSRAPRAPVAAPPAAPPVVVEAAAKPAPAPFDKWSLWSAESSESRPARLRGANIWQKVVDPVRDGDALGTAVVGPPYARGELDELARLGANYVNVSHAGIFSEAPPYAVLPDVVASLDRLLDAIEAADMFAVIAFRTGPGRNEAAFGNGGAHGPAENHGIFTRRDAQDAWVAMWRYAAARYRSRVAVVAYDLMVEPNAGEALFGSPGPARFYAEHKGDAADWNPLAARIVAAIRQVDESTPCIVEAMGFASPSWLPYVVPPSDARTLLGVHLYEPHVYTHPANVPAGDDVGYPQLVDVKRDGHPELIARPWLTRLVDRVAEDARTLGRPVVVNELGVTRWARGSDGYLRDALDALDAAAVSHAAWLWESRWPKIDYDAFNVRRGVLRERHVEVPLAENPLLRVLAASWSKNTLRPSSLANPPPSRPK